MRNDVENPQLSLKSALSDNEVLYTCDLLYTVRLVRSDMVAQLRCVFGSFAIAGADATVIANNFAARLCRAGT